MGTKTISTFMLLEASDRHRGGALVPHRVGILLHSPDLRGDARIHMRGDYES